MHWYGKKALKLNASIGESPEEGENLAPECGLHVPWCPENLGKASVPERIFMFFFFV